MSKKIFLKKSYADAVKGSGENSADFESEVLEDYHPGESIIKPQWTGFTYSEILDSEASSSEKLPTINRRKKTTLKRRIHVTKVIDEDIDEIIEILSSPEKSPFKICELSDSSSTSPSSLKKARRRLLREEDSPLQESIAISSDPESESDSLPSIDSPLFEVPPSSPMPLSSPPASPEALPSSLETDNLYYQNDPLMPVYKRSSKGVDTKEAVQTLLSIRDENNIAKNIPSHINENISFVYSIKFIGHWKNVLCDGMGSWKQTGKQTNTVNTHDIGYDISSELKDDLKDCLALKSIRHKFVNNTQPDLHRIVIHLEKTDGTVLDRVFVQYYFGKEPNYFQPNPHKNSKKNESYRRTNETTKLKIKCLINDDKMKPKAVFHKIVEDQGGIENALGGAYLPRDRQQIRNFARNSEEKNHDSIEELMDLAKSQEKVKNIFVREVRCVPEFTVFMATDRQIREVQKYCTNLKNFSVLGVDTTFNIGAFFVTFTTYRNTMLLTKKGTEPVMIGPILIHQRKNFDSYFKLSSSILQICPEMKSLKVFGTDGDKNLSDAFEVCFTSAKHLLCDIHMQDNIERKLKELGIQKKEAKSYIEDIFGKISHETKIKGLVDSMSPEEFDEKLSSLQNEWKSRHSSGLSFLDYFLEHKAELIKNCMNADLRSLAGLGYPPQPYNQNANECMNAIIKGDLRKNEEGKLKMSEKDFVISLEKIVKRQETEVKLALIGKGEYRLKTEYQHLEVTEDIYWRKSVTQREAVFEKMLREPLKSKGDETVVENRPVDDAAQSLFTSYPSAESTDITNIPFPILESIFQDSKIIFQSSNGIVQMPGCDDKSAFFVLNKNQTSDPFKVHRSKCTTLFTCEMKCHRYNCYKLCEHTTATAFHCNLLTDYIQQYKKKHNSERNLTAISLTGMPRNRGKKPKGTSIRKGRNNKTFTEAMDYAVSTKSSLEQPFHLTFLAGLVKKCYGCGQQFSDKLRAPPNDLVLKRYDHRKYLSPNSKTQRVSTSLQNTYYHLNSDCCRRHCPMFEMCRDVIIHSEILSQLSTAHKNILVKLKIISP